jgi:hypothetical protein
MKQSCNGGPGTWTLHTMVAPARLGAGAWHRRPEHFFTREEALAARAAWNERHAGNPDAVASVAPWQAGTETKKALNKAKLKGRR